MPQAVQTLIHRVIHTYVYVYVYIYDVYTALLIGKSPNIRSNTVHIYDSGQPYLSTYMLFTSTTCPWGDLCYIYLICQFVSYRDYCHTPLPVTCSYLLVTRSYLPVTHPYLSHAPTCHMPLPVTCPYLSRAPTCHTLLSTYHTLLSTYHTPLPVTRSYLSRAPIYLSHAPIYLSYATTCHMPLPVGERPKQDTEYEMSCSIERHACGGRGGASTTCMPCKDDDVCCTKSEQGECQGSPASDYFQITTRLSVLHWGPGTESVRECMPCGKSFLHQSEL